ncbi:MAG: M20/M25/M40 family metallo-hydrolase [Clostridia bacterium]|nr:M20/M25/M40 family metallo-hydrolase [Clostridia bacterium]
MWWLILVGVLLLFVAVLLIRTLRFTPKPPVEQLSGEENFDKDVAVSNLQQLIRCKTVSYADPQLEDDAESEKLINLLPSLYPHVFNTCSFQKLPDRALLFCWKGQTPGDPAVLMAHYDVVPVEEDGWDKPAFEGLLEDGVLWGRGALDTKVTFNGILFAANHLIAEGFIPEHDIYFAFSGGEEVNGNGAVRIVDWFEEKGITPSIVVDEGGGVVENVFPGVKTPCGMIGIAEKGLLNARYRVQSGGGHASAPKPNGPVDRLAAACCRVLKKPFPYHITPPVAAMFDTLGRHSSFVYRLIFANLWLFAPVLDMICKSSGGDLNALMRTTVAFTQMRGSKAPNVIPPNAELISNMRLNPYDTMESALEHLRRAVNDDSVEITALEGMNPSRISQVDCPAWDKVARAVATTWKGCLVSPYLMVQCSDSRHYGRISDKVYRFSAMDLTAEERATIHGNNERIRVDCLHRAVEFFIRLMRQC